MSGEPTRNAMRATDPDSIARAQGFPNYATMIAWQQRRSESLRTNNTVSEGGPSATPQRPLPPANQTERSWFQSLMHAFGAPGY